MDKYSRSKQIWITILGGWFGLHYYLDKQYGKAVLYTLTIGIFEIGWFIDIYKVCKQKSNYQNAINKVETQTKNINQLNKTQAIHSLQLQAENFNRILSDVQCGFKNLNPYLSRYKLLLEIYDEMENLDTKYNLNALSYDSKMLYDTLNTELLKFIKNKILVTLDKHSIDNDDNKALIKDLKKIRNDVIEGKHEYPEFSELLQEIQFQIENQLSKF